MGGRFEAPESGELNPTLYEYTDAAKKRARQTMDARAFSKLSMPHTNPSSLHFPIISCPNLVSNQVMTPTHLRIKRLITGVVANQTMGFPFSFALGYEAIILCSSCSRSPTDSVTSFQKQEFLKFCVHLHVLFDFSKTYGCRFANVVLLSTGTERLASTLHSNDLICILCVVSNQ